MSARFLRGKYGAKRENGFASKRESRRAQELKMLEKLGEISELEYQVRYELIPKNADERACHYVADFRYKANGETVIEDAKGFRTDVYKLKRKLMRHVHNIKVLET